MRALALALVLCGALLAPRIARAEDRLVVTVVRPARAGKIIEEATMRLTGELRSVGFSVRLVDGAPGADGRAQVERDGGAMATLAILDTQRGAEVDVWVADHVTKKTLVRRVAVGDPRGTNAASDLAVRSAELLRASLLEVRGERRRELPPEVAQWIAEAAPPPPPATPAPPPRPAPVEPPRPAAPAPVVAPPAPVRSPPAPSAAEDRRASVEAGFAMLTGAVGVAPGAYLRVACSFPASLSLRASLVPGMATIRLEAASRSVTLRQTVATVELAYHFGLQSRRIFPIVAVGAGLYQLGVDGSAELPYRGKHHDFTAAAFTLGAGLGVNITPNLAATAALDALLLAPPPIIEIAGTEVGRTGRPAFLPTVGLRASH
jgi:hypothetical protein